MGSAGVVGSGHTAVCGVIMAGLTEKTYRR